MDEQPPLQFSLRTLMIVVTIAAVIFVSLPFLMSPSAVGVGHPVPTRYTDEGGHPIMDYTTVNPEAKWRWIVLFMDVSLIGLAIWLVRRIR